MDIQKVHDMVTELEAQARNLKDVEEQIDLVEIVFRNESGVMEEIKTQRERIRALREEILKALKNLQYYLA